MSLHRGDIRGMKTPLRERFGLRVKALRLASGLSQEAFADHASIARSYMSRIERGMANPSLDAVESLADALGVDPSQLFEIVEPPASYDAALEVPFAADGTCFHPGLASPRDGTFRVGGKPTELRFGSFDEALAYLKTMPVAKWRRPNDSGNWGLVSAVRWEKAEKRKSTSR
jgi:transcriptional regulator with XRE-family HTH domain